MFLINRRDAMFVSQKSRSFFCLCVLCLSGVIAPRAADVKNAFSGAETAKSFARDENDQTAELLLQQFERDAIRDAKVNHPVTRIEPPFPEEPSSRLDDYRHHDEEEEKAAGVLRHGESVGASEKVAPKYMLELYKKFSNDKYSHPIANIVRSFLNINKGVRPVRTVGGRTIIALHTLLFNISSVGREEDIYLAELRLFAADKTERILVYEVVHLASGNETTSYSSHSSSHSPPPRRYQLLTTRELPDGQGGVWETFSVTDVVRRWVRSQATAGHILEVRVDTAGPSSPEPEEQWNTGSSSNQTSYDPILVVFSNDRKRRKIELRELHEIQSHENGIHAAAASAADEDGYPGEEDGDTGSEYMWEDEYEEEDFEQTDIDLGGHGQPETGRKSSPSGRVKRNSNHSRRRRAKRNSCRRKPMFVDFRDLAWDSWIIRPSGYQAYECTGQCYFPLSEHLTPTKYAMVKSLLRSLYPKKTSSAVCCVPTRLEPIPLLYMDDRGTVTYKYKYDGMVVAECGCR